LQFNHDVVKKVKSFLSHKAHRAALISVSLALNQTPAYTARPQIWGWCIAQCACLLSSFRCTHCAYPWRDGQAELTWVADYIPRWFTHPQIVTHPNTNQARRRVTSLITTNALTTTPCHHICIVLLLCTVFLCEPLRANTLLRIQSVNLFFVVGPSGHWQHLCSAHADARDQRRCRAESF